MKTANPKCDYDNDGERITAPGKFEGEPIFTPYLWDLALAGGADRDDGKAYAFKFTTQQLSVEHFGAELSRWLGHKRTLRMSENSQGFVHCF